MKHVKLPSPRHLRNLSPAICRRRFHKIRGKNYGLERNKNAAIICVCRPFCGHLRAPHPRSRVVVFVFKKGRSAAVARGYKKKILFTAPELIDAPRKLKPVQNRLFL